MLALAALVELEGDLVARTLAACPETDSAAREGDRWRTFTAVVAGPQPRLRPPPSPLRSSRAALRKASQTMLSARVTRT